MCSISARFQTLRCLVTDIVLSRSTWHFTVSTVFALLIIKLPAASGRKIAYTRSYIEAVKVAQWAEKYDVLKNIIFKSREHLQKAF